MVKDTIIGRILNIEETHIMFILESFVFYQIKNTIYCDKKNIRKINEKI